MVKDNSSNVPSCQTSYLIERDSLNLLRTEVLNSEKAQRMAEFFSLLGDANRLRIVSILAKQEVCVCDLAILLEMSDSAVSHQLRTLRSLKIVSYKKRGRKVYYCLQDYHVLDLYNSVAEHLDETDIPQKN